MSLETCFMMRGYKKRIQIYSVWSVHLTTIAYSAGNIFVVWPSSDLCFTDPLFLSLSFSLSDTNTPSPPGFLRLLQLKESGRRCTSKPCSLHLPRCALQCSSFVVLPGDMDTRLSHTELKIETLIPALWTKAARKTIKRTRGNLCW